MKKIKNILLTGLCMILVLALVACSTGGAPPSSEPASSSEASASVSAAPAEKSDDAGTAATGDIDPTKLKVAVMLGWMENESGWRQKQGYEETFAKLGITDVTYNDANYDPVLQSEQIEAVIQTKPDAIFVVPANAAGLSEAVHHALDAGIPVFLSDGTVYGAEDDVTGQIVVDNYSGGYASMEYLAKQLDYKGNVALIKLDPQPAWKPRSDAALDVIAKYPDMKVVAEWSWDSTGVNTPRMAVDQFLAANPNVGDIDAIWCAWDTAAMEGIEACKAAGREEIIFCGFDGGEPALKALDEEKQFVVSIGPCIYSQAEQNVMNMIDYLNGKEIEQSTNATCVILDKEGIKGIKPEGDEKAVDYDKPGMAEKWGLSIVQTVTPEA